MILFVGLQVLCEFNNPCCQDSDLDLRRTGIRLSVPVIFDYLTFFFFRQHLLNSDPFVFQTEGNTFPQLTSGGQFRLYALNNADLGLNLYQFYSFVTVLYQNSTLCNTFFLINFVSHDFIEVYKTFLVRPDCPVLQKLKITWYAYPCRLSSRRSFWQ